MLRNEAKKAPKIEEFEFFMYGRSKKVYARNTQKEYYKNGSIT